MAVKTTFGSGFRFRFVFYALDFVENEYNIEGVPPTVFEIFGVKVEKFKNYLNELGEFPIQKILICCGPCGPLTLCRKLERSIEEKKVRRYSRFGT